MYCIITCVAQREGERCSGEEGREEEGRTGERGRGERGRGERGRGGEGERGRGGEGERGRGEENCSRKEKKVKENATPHTSRWQHKVMEGYVHLHRIRSYLLRSDTLNHDTCQRSTSVSFHFELRLNFQAKFGPKIHRDFVENLFACDSSSSSSPRHIIYYTLPAVFNIYLRCKTHSHTLYNHVT